MDRKTATVVGAAAALAASAGLAQAAPAPAVPPAASYAELLQPIPNAVERLRMSDMEMASRPARLIQAQYDQHHHHDHYQDNHHHHHDNAWYQTRGYVWRGGVWVAPGGPAVGFQFQPAPRGDFWYGAPTTIDERIGWLEQRIDRMAQNGRINPGEAARNRNELEGLRHEVQDIRARHGQLEPDQRDHVIRSLNNVSARLNWRADQGY